MFWPSSGRAASGACCQPIRRSTGGGALRFAHGMTGCGNSMSSTRPFDQPGTQPESGSNWSVVGLECDPIAAVQVRELRRGLGFEPGERRLAELGPPQKTRQLNKRGRTLRITTSLLVRGSCGITRPFGDAELMRRYLESGEHTKFRRRL